MGYKVGDEVLVKARIIEDCIGICGLKTQEGIVFNAKKENLLPIPDMTAEEAWEIARNLFANYSNAELDDIFGKEWSFPKLMELTPQEAKAKIEEWEAEKEINVGDVVNHIHGNRLGVVTGIDSTGDMLDILWIDGTLYRMNREYAEKVGRHIDIEGLLKQIGGDE